MLLDGGHTLSQRDWAESFSAMNKMMPLCSISPKGNKRRNINLYGPITIANVFTRWNDARARFSPRYTESQPCNIPLLSVARLRIRLQLIFSCYEATIASPPSWRCMSTSTRRRGLRSRVEGMGRHIRGSAQPRPLSIHQRLNGIYTWCRRAARWTSVYYDWCRGSGWIQCYPGQGKGRMAMWRWVDKHAWCEIVFHLYGRRS